MATDSRGSRLLSDLNSAFRRDPDIDEYDFLPVLEPKHNRSPLILQEHKLGLEMWSVKILYDHAYNTLMAWRQKEAHAKFLDPFDLISLSRAVVLVNADCLTAWNIRKELVESSDLNIIDDLKFGALVLSRHPKSPETFCHRKWLLRRYVDCCLSSSNGSTTSTGSLYNDFVNMDAIDFDLEAEANNFLLMDNNVHGMNQQPDFHEIMRREITVCRKAAEKYPCNYNAWSHRSWVVQNCYNCTIQVLVGELHATEAWVRRHISDHSGFHYRQYLLTNIHKQADTLKEQFSLNYRNLIHKEMQIVVDLLKSYTDHEALWYHRRYVFQALCKVCDSETVSVDMITLPGGYDQDLPIKNSQKKTKLENERQVLLLKEVDMVSRNHLSTKNTFKKGLAQKYLDWIQKSCRS
ncbi:protein prenyltransferase alpha subunit repeat-containing protein 1-like [Ylistrum balloti]|uniref:protein prenyltransferase alpha subunit repeat-containing protein 1-like n=1 Tax=Ylistrum balloti TaxID=509963 RepID=UPI002905AF8A|nr:protein prenyltransferase alpha subunit repeat-containing protein 1-like [Ylistrum balloti]